MNNKFSMGIDYGTQGCRAIIVEILSGKEIATASCPYPHKVMEEYLLVEDEKISLPPDWALQHPQDYLEVLEKVCKEVMVKSNVSPEDIVGVGVDFTACTILPIDVNGTPLCFTKTFKKNPHAYVKLWKHHAAQKYADQITDLALERDESFISRYGNKISSEWLLPKVMEIKKDAPEIYKAADKFVEAGDWIVSQLIGEEKRSSCMAGYKGLWHKKEGYPSHAFLKALDPELENLVEEKLSNDIQPLGGKAGEITEYGHKLTGLNKGTSVGVAIIDAHAAVPAAGIADEGKMLMIIGTSTCHMLLAKEEKVVPGIAGFVQDGILPNFIGYEAGQACVGDHFGWFVKHCVPIHYHKEAEERNIDIHQLLTEKAALLDVGQSGLIALDWWNGNRSILVDSDLTGLILGMTLTTKPEEIYRALIEATAFGTKIIVENFIKHDVPVNELFAAGGIAQKNALMMQIYADVLGMNIHICGSDEAVALGSAIFGAAAAGEKSGINSIYEGVQQMSNVKRDAYKFNTDNHHKYNTLFAHYKTLHDYFGTENAKIMKDLKRMKK